MSAAEPNFHRGIWVPAEVFDAWLVDHTIGPDEVFAYMMLSTLPEGSPPPSTILRLPKKRVPEIIRRLRVAGLLPKNIRDGGRHGK